MSKGYEILKKYEEPTLTSGLNYDSVISDNRYEISADILQIIPELTTDN